MAGDYTALAPIYTRSGLGNYSKYVTGKLHDYAQAHEWMGRRILDIGCGSGSVLSWFAENRPRLQLIGVDNNPTMLNQAGVELPNSAQWIEQDIKQLEGITEIDMALAINVINEVDSVRDLGEVFKKIHNTLNPGKIFTFDLHTVEGLAQLGRQGDTSIINEPDLAVFSRNDYDFERQAYTADYTIFHHTDEAWVRGTANRVLKAYPVQAIATLLRRSGFEIKALLGENFSPLPTPVPGTLRVFFVAVKQ